MTLRVFVTGGTGFVGRAVASALRARGDEVVALSRRPGADVTGDPMVAGPWMDALRGCDAVLHLAGESIASGRLGAAHRRRVLDSRVLGTRHVVAAIAAAPVGQRPRVLVSASGVDRYAFDESDRAHDEHVPPGDSFLADVCVAWEHEAEAARSADARVICLRLGLVLGTNGGAWPRIVAPFRFGLGGPLGSGRQWFSWVHEHDAVAACLHALDHAPLDGPVNLVAPECVRSAQLASVLGRTLSRPARFALPAPLVRLAVGGLAPYVLGGRRVVPAALLRTGFTFRFGTLERALPALLLRPAAQG